MYYFTVLLLHYYILLYHTGDTELRTMCGSEMVPGAGEKSAYK